MLGDSRGLNIVVGWTHERTKVMMQEIPVLKKIKNTVRLGVFLSEGGPSLEFCGER